MQTASSKWIQRPQLCSMSFPVGPSSSLFYNCHRPSPFRSKQICDLRSEWLLRTHCWSASLFFRWHSKKGKVRTRFLCQSQKKQSINLFFFFGVVDIQIPNIYHWRAIVEKQFCGHHQFENGFLVAKPAADHSFVWASMTTEKSCNGQWYLEFLSGCDTWGCTTHPEQIVEEKIRQNFPKNRKQTSKI